MVRLAIWAACCAGLAGATPAFAQSFSGSNPLLAPGGMTIEEAGAVFKRNDLPFEITGPVNARSEGFDLNGYNCNAAQRCTEFLFSAGVDLPDGFPLERINEWNADELIGRAYLDEEKDPWLDHLVSVSGPQDDGAFEEGLIAWLAGLSKFLDFLDKGDGMI